MIGQDYDIGREWNRQIHGDPRTAIPPTLRDMQSGAVCSTMRHCAEVNVLVSITRDAGGLQHFHGRCVTCGRTFYAVGS